MPASYGNGNGNDGSSHDHDEDVYSTDFPTAWKIY